MTTQGERDPRPAGQHADVPVQTHRARGGRRRIVVGCALVAVVAGGGWIVTRPDPGQLIPGLGRSSTDVTKAVPTAGAASAQPLTEAQGFTADHYFPASRTVEADAFRAKRTVGRQGADCAETLRDRAHDVLHGAGCQGYVTVGFAELDQPVLTSVTVLRFADEKTAANAAEKLAKEPDALAFATADAATPGKPLTASRVEQVGHYLTVTTSRFTDGRTTTPTPAPLADATRAISYTAGAPFIWL